MTNKEVDNLAEMIGRVGKSVVLPEEHHEMLDSLVKDGYVAHAAFVAASKLKLETYQNLHQFLELIAPELKEWKYEYFFKTYSAKLVIPKEMAEE